MTEMPLLLSMTEQALDRWDRIRRYFFRDVFVARIEQAQQEHHAILQAMREQDKARIAICSNSIIGKHWHLIWHIWTARHQNPPVW